MKTAAKFFLCVMLMGGCVATDVDRYADFSRYQTYAWGKSKQSVVNPLYRSNFIDENIKMTIREEFTKKGLVFRKPGPDLLVRYETYTETQRGYTGSTWAPYPAYPFWPYAWFGYGWGGPYAWYPMPMGGTYAYTTGTLVIDIFDRKTGKQIWRGSASADLDDPEKLNKQIQKGVKAILRKFPATAPQGPAIPGKEKAIASASRHR